MARRPTSSQLADQVADLIKVLKLAQQVFPTLAEQARLELNELRGGLPTSERGAYYSDDPPPYYSDPTGETVVHFRAAVDGDCRPVEDLERIARWVSDVQHLIGATRKMLNQAPAVTLAVVDGRKPTDGRSAEEHAQRKFVRVLSGEPCLVDQDHEEQDRFGPGQLRRGLCNRHRMAFARWQLANGANLADVDETGRLVRWQHETYGVVANEDPARKTATGGPYRDNLREVA